MMAWLRTSLGREGLGLLIMIIGWESELLTTLLP